MRLHNGAIKLPTAPLTDEWVNFTLGKLEFRRGGRARRFFPRFVFSFRLFVTIIYLDEREKDSRGESRESCESTEKRLWKFKAQYSKVSFPLLRRIR